MLRQHIVTLSKCLQKRYKNQISPRSLCLQNSDKIIFTGLWISVVKFVTFGQNACFFRWWSENDGPQFCKQMSKPSIGLNWFIEKSFLVQAIIIWTKSKYLGFVRYGRLVKVEYKVEYACSSRVSIYPTFARRIENSLLKLILSFGFFLAPLCVALVAYVESAERDLLKAMYNAAKWPLNDPFEWSPPST